MDSHKLFLPCPLFEEDLLTAEAERLGATGSRQTRAGVYCTATQETLQTLLLYSRIAGRLLLLAGEGENPEKTAASEKKTGDILYQAALEIPWEEFFDSGKSIVCKVTGLTGEGEHSGFLALRFKDAVADRFRDKTGQRPSVDKDNPDMPLEAHIDRDKIFFYMDLSPAGGLHRRGWRIRSTEAPLRENTAAALLVRAGWPETAARGGSLIDPLCGSGTFLIEAALMAGDIAPGLGRDRYGAESWNGFDHRLWKKLRSDAEARAVVGIHKIPRMAGSDRDFGAVKSALANVEKAGLGLLLKDGRLKIIPKALKDLTAADFKGLRPGLAVTNPPYGERLGEKEELPPLYRQIGYTLRKEFPGFRPALIAADKELGFETGFPAASLHTLMNGPLKCWFLMMGEAPADPLSVLTVSGQQFGNRIKKNLKERGAKSRKEGVTCWRLYDADLPDYNAAIDLYGDDYAVVQEYAAPSEIDRNKTERRLNEMLRSLPWLLGRHPENIFLKVRRRQKGKDQYDKNESPETTAVITEGVCRFLVNFTGYLDTGIFLDHRPVRLKIGALSAGKSFLNLFSYTGTATVHAAVGGAANSVSVDTSAAYQEWARKNLALNNQENPKHKLVREEVFQFLRTNREKFDLIFCDPPTFSNSKSRDGELDIQRDHGALLDLLWRTLAPWGMILFSCNFRKFAMEWSVPEGGTMREITAETIPFDFERSGGIHRCWEITRG
jgi:23S rRNA (guanine2445-N2)-methyltransferase / 23S rRNA (guanine2069-N7)-methyltransferase